MDPGGVQGHACEWAEKVLEEKQGNTPDKLDFFMQEFRTWSTWTVDKLLVTGVATEFAGKAAYEKESAELREMQHQMKWAQG
jgi:hypothetical protein